MTKNIVAFDLEATGLDVQNDFILQLGLVKFDSTTFEQVDSRNWYIKPDQDFTIAPAAQEATGITKEFILENGVSLRSIWDEAVAFIGDCDMLSYNGLKYDIPLLWNNLIRLNLHFDFKSRKMYDSLLVERKRYSMKLGNVYKRYTGEEMPDAHDALGDVKGLITVFAHQVKQGTEDFEDTAFSIASPEGFVRLNDEGDLIFATGKYKNETTNSICEKDPMYIKWVFEKFSEITRESIRNSWREYKNNQQ